MYRKDLVSKRELINNLIVSYFSGIYYRLQKIISLGILNNCFDKTSHKVKKRNKQKRKIRCIFIELIN